MESSATVIEEVRPAAQVRSAGWKQRAWFFTWRLLVIAAFVVVGWYSYVTGQQLREWTWNYTAPIHFFYDMNNGFYWGSQAWEPWDQRDRRSKPPGILNVYDVVARRSRDYDGDDKKDYGLDYAPLRLTLISTWVKWTQDAYPNLHVIARRSAGRGSNPTYWEAPFKFYKPMLDFNTAMEVVGVVGLFLLARHWVVRGWRGKARPDIPPGRGWPWHRLYDWFTSPRPFRGWIAGAFAGLLFWFNPAVLLSAHGWPTWDMWVIPFFIWALYLACIDFWFVSGLVIAAAAMFKGQQLLVAPIFLLWPIFAGRPLMAIKWAAGFVFGIAAIASPWMLTYVPDGQPLATGSRVLHRAAVNWLTMIAVMAVLFVPLLKWARPWRTNRWHPAARWAAWLLPIPMIAWIVMPYVQWDSTASVPPITIYLALAFAVGVALVPIRWMPILTAGTLGAAVLSCGYFYDASMNWAKIGWGYGTRHYPVMQQGTSDNLAGILQKRYGWQPDNTVFTYDGLSTGQHAATVGVYAIACAALFWVTVTRAKVRDPRYFTAAAVGWLSICASAYFLFVRQKLLPPAAPVEVPMRTFLGLLYVATFLLCIIGAAMHYRRNDPRFLVAMTGAWVVFFAFLPQMHERYLIYAAGVACSLTAVSVGFTLLGVIMSIWTTVMTFHPMLGQAARAGRLTQFWVNEQGESNAPQLFKFLQFSHPDAGWAIIVIALIFIYVSVAPRKRPLA
jgi:hypothetical protein